METSPLDRIQQRPAVLLSILEGIVFRADPAFRCAESSTQGPELGGTDMPRQSSAWLAPCSFFAPVYRTARS